MVPTQCRKNKPNSWCSYET